MTNNPIDPKKQNAAEYQQNQLSDQELEKVAGGGIFDGIKDLANDVYEEGKEFISDVSDGINTIKKTL